MDHGPQAREPSHRWVTRWRQVGTLALVVLGIATAGSAGAVAPAVVAGSLHTCALTSGGAVKCWGANSSGQLGDGTVTDRLTPVDVVGVAGGVVAITAGERHTCAITSGGAVKCWGWNDRGQLGDGTSNTDRLTPVDVVGLTSGVVAIAAGGFHTCALTRGGAVKCWGENVDGQVGDGTGQWRPIPVDVVGLASRFVAIAAGGSHTCALASGGAVKCWGWNERGQLGDGTSANRWMPIDVAGLASGVVAISAGARHTCALTGGGAAKCWGENYRSQLGDGTVGTNRLTPVDVVGLASGAVAISASEFHTCALTSGGAVKCWGENDWGQLGDGTRYASRLTPVDAVGLASGIVAIAAGAGHTCALTSGGAVKCWGWNDYGQLGDGPSGSQLRPVDVVGLTSGVVAIAAGYGNTCALTSGGAAKCWGNAPVGNGTLEWRLTPVDVVGLPSGVVAIATGRSHFCALTSGGAAKCWGHNNNGQLGDGTVGTGRLTPVDVVGLASGVVAISAGEYHSCALTSPGAVKCWGDNTFGQLGDGTITDRLTPTDVAGLANDIVAISARRSHTCALTSGGAVKCWGWNNDGQLGDSTTMDRSTPVDVVGLASGAVAISVGGTHTCALASGGGVKCWGQNDWGQLGDGTAGTDRLTPVDVVGLASGVVGIVGGGDHTCALTSGGAVKCWGENSRGQLGDGTVGTNRLTPVDVVDLASGVVGIAAGQRHSCALTSGGAVKCWGSNSVGQLGIEFIRMVVGLDLDGDAAVAEVPTLSAWMLVVSSLLLVGWAYLARRTAFPRFGPRP